MALLNAADHMPHHSSAGNPKKHRTHPTFSPSAHQSVRVGCPTQKFVDQADCNLRERYTARSWRTGRPSRFCQHHSDLNNRGHLRAPPSQPKIFVIAQLPLIATASACCIGMMCTSDGVVFMHLPSPRCCAAPNEVFRLPKWAPQSPALRIVHGSCQ